MKYLISIIFLINSTFIFAQDNEDATDKYKKRVLENAEIDFLSSYYTQDGENASITGGIGTEDLQDIAANITIAIPLNDDSIFRVDATISAYTSASSSNVDPFTGASTGGEEEDDDRIGDSNPIGSPWIASSGASKSDVWSSGVFSYEHFSDDRNKIWSTNLSVAAEYDYFSVGLGGSHKWLFNQKNTTFGINGNVYIDTWNPVYPTEIDSYIEANQNLNNGFFDGVDILDQQGNVIDKDGSNVWTPSSKGLIKDKGRNTFAGSVSFSQILSKKAQFSLFFDVVLQEGWLANPSQRVYFGDKNNFFIGNPESIPNYTSTSNKDVFQLADDIERLPNTRFKIPVGMRFNYYLNERFVLKTYYRYYTDDWGVNSHIVEVEMPIKIAKKFTLYPSYRYYTQTQADYFAPFDENLSTQEFYTSDYDLSSFDSNQYGFGIRYTDIFTKSHIWKLHLKQADLKYSHYDRSTGLQSDIISLGFKFVFK